MFERITYIDPSREIPIERERGRIEMSDQEYLEKLMLSREMLDAGFVCNTPDESTMNPALKNKFNLAKIIEEEMKIIDAREKNAKNKSKVPKKTVKKANTKSNASTVESIQK